MKLLFLFLDGVGLGIDDPHINPFALAEMPHLQDLLGGKRLLFDTIPTRKVGDPTSSASLETERATLLALDANLGVGGLPQSATGQASLLTGINVPAAIGYHYGPKPNQVVAEFLKNGNIFNTLQHRGRTATLFNAYPPGYFAAIESGRRLFSAIPLAISYAGLPLKTSQDLNAGTALSADFTGQGWRNHLGLCETPVITNFQAGERLAVLAQEVDLAFFEFWLSDYAGHAQDKESAYTMLASIDQVLAGLLAAWNDEEGLILITSDHGNLEDLSTRRHTLNPVPALLIGKPADRNIFNASLHDLTGVTPAILNFLEAGI